MHVPTDSNNRLHGGKERAALGGFATGKSKWGMHGVVVGLGGLRGFPVVQGTCACAHASCIHYMRACAR